MIEEKVGNRIKELRSKLGISQEELGFRSGVHRTYIASLEVGKRNVSIATLEKIVIALECDLTQTQDGIKIIRALDFLLSRNSYTK